MLCGCSAVLSELATETLKYLLPKRFESRNFEEALMAGIFIFSWRTVLVGCECCTC